MKIGIVTDDSDSSLMVREYMQRKVNFAVGRFGARIGKVVARLQDQSTESSVFEGVCSIEVELVPDGHIHVSANGESPFDCVLQAVQKMEQALKHEIDRSRALNRTRHQQANGKAQEHNHQNGKSDT